MFEAAITESENGGHEIDVLKTAKAQTMWNKWPGAQVLVLNLGLP